MSDCKHDWFEDVPSGISCSKCNRHFVADDINILMARAEQAEARVAELEKAIYSALENATDTIWVSEIGTLQDFMGKEQS